MNTLQPSLIWDPLTTTQQLLGRTTDVVIVLSLHPNQKLMNVNSKQATSGQQQRNLNAAHTRALLIHHQKEIEAQILASIEELAEYPASKQPSKVETEAFLKQISLFQPSDLDDLVTERDVQTRCGHVLCPNQPRLGARQTRRLEDRLLGLHDGSDKWCSELCMEKTVWIRQQLPSEPAWQRARRPAVTLHPHDRSLLISPRTTVPELLANNINDAVDLARERGEEITSWKPQQVMTATLVERPKTWKANAPSESSGHAASIEGYAPKVHTEPGSRRHASGTSRGKLSLDGEVSNQQADVIEEQSWHDMFEHLHADNTTGLNSENTANAFA